MISNSIISIHSKIEFKQLIHLPQKKNYELIL